MAMSMLSKIIFCHSQLQQKLIKNSLPYVQKYGWTDNAILAACNNLDFSPASHRIITPYDMISHCMKGWNKEALRVVDDSNFEGRKKIKEKVHFSIKTRLLLELEYIDTWHQAMGIGALPQNMGCTREMLWEYSDQIWRRCGDKSTDYNYYTKRILFNAAYASTELHLLTDKSHAQEASWQFLQRRLDDILSMGTGIQNLKVAGGAAVDGLFSIVAGLKSPPTSEIVQPIHKFRSQQDSADQDPTPKADQEHQQPEHKKNDSSPI